MNSGRPPPDLDRFGLSPSTGAEDRTADAASDGKTLMIRKLHEGHRDRIEAHLLQLDDRDRYLRFGMATHSAQVAQYVASLNFQKDKVFGVFDRQLRLIAVAHLAHLSGLSKPRQASATSKVMEFGVSVLPSGRGQGLGMQLFQHAIMHARNHQATHLMIYALSENAPMLKIAAKAGATIERHGPEAEAWLRLPPDTMGSHLDSSWQSLSAELNYGFRHQMLTLSDKLRNLMPTA